MLFYDNGWSYKISHHHFSMTNTKINSITETNDSSNEIWQRPWRSKIIHYVNHV